MRSIFRANTFCDCPSFGAPFRHESQTRANVPEWLASKYIILAHEPTISVQLTSTNSLNQIKICNPEVLRCDPQFFATRGLRNLSWRERRSIAFVARNKVLLSSLLLFIDWLLIDEVAAVASKEMMTVRGVEGVTEFCGSHRLHTLEAYSPRADAG